MTPWKRRGESPLKWTFNVAYHTSMLILCMFAMCEWIPEHYGGG